MPGPEDLLMNDDIEAIEELDALEEADALEELTVLDGIPTEDGSVEIMVEEPDEDLDAYEAEDEEPAGDANAEDGIAENGSVEEDIVENDIADDDIVEDDISDGGNAEDEDDDPSRLIDAVPGEAQEEGPRRTANMIGVRFRIAGKIYYFDAGDLNVRRGDHVIVETVRGVEYGYVVADPPMLASKRSPRPLKKILKIADAADDEQAKNGRVREREAFRICQERIRAHELEMKLIDAEYTFDNSKLLFYFTADGRVDFRELVKDLATIFRIRIELRQIGVRDETQILGGYGICGRVLCCHSFLSDFAPVSIKMAKEQSLSLNQTKISGVCGRLMCCLKNEEETYEELKKTLPGVGDEVEGADGLTGEVASVNVLRQTIRILVEVDDEKEIHEYGEGEWTLIRKRRRGQARHSKKEIEKVQQEQQAAGRARRLDRKKNNSQEAADKGADGKETAERTERTERRSRNDRANRNAPDREAREANGAERGERTDKKDRNNGDSRPRRRKRPLPGEGTAQAKEAQAEAAGTQGKGQPSDENGGKPKNQNRRRRRGGRGRGGNGGEGGAEAGQNNRKRENAGSGARNE